MLAILGKILLQIAMSLIADPVLIRKVLLELAHKAAKLTPTDIDDHIIDLIEQSIDKSSGDSK
jgi:hypothetical protein